MDTNKIINRILEHEGGYVDHPHDRGGATNFGITQKTLSAWRNEPVKKHDVEQLTEREARAIYLHKYINLPRFNLIKHPALSALMVDCGVLHGTKRATQWLQGVVGVKQDGRLGPKSLHAINTQNGAALYAKLLAVRVRFIGRLITRDRRQASFAAGWMNRCADFIEDAPHE